MIRARALKSIRRASVPNENSFVEHMNHLADNNKNWSLSEKQDAWLAKICWKYRGQLQSGNWAHAVPAQSPFEEDNKYTTAGDRETTATKE